MIATLAGKQIALLLLALVAAMPYGWRAAGSVALGGGIQVVNLRALERTVAGVLGLGAAGHRVVPALLVQLRWVLLLGVVGYVLVATPVAPLFLVAGLSTAMLAALWHGVDTARTKRRGSA